MQAKCVTFLKIAKINILSYQNTAVNTVNIIWVFFVISIKIVTARSFLKTFLKRQPKI